MRMCTVGCLFFRLKSVCFGLRWLLRIGEQKSIGNRGVSSVCTASASASWLVDASAAGNGAQEPKSHAHHIYMADGRKSRVDMNL